MTTLVRIVLLLAVLAPSLARAGSDGPPPGIMRVGMGGPFHGPMPFGDDPGLMLPMLLQGVGLTDDQKKEVRDILKADRTTLFGLFDQLRTANQALADKLVSDRPGHGGRPAAAGGPGDEGPRRHREPRSQGGPAGPRPAHRRSAREGRRREDEDAGAPRTDARSAGRARGQSAGRAGLTACPQ